MNKNIYNSNFNIYLNYGYLMLPLNLNIIPKIKIGTQTFFSKNGYHVSLLYLKDLTEPEQKKVLKYAQNFTVKLKEITKNYCLVKEKNFQSIIVRVKLQGLRKLISAINKQYSCSFVYPPTHITLFTLKDMDGGIGLNSKSEYELLAHPINLIDSRKLTKSFKLIK